MKAKVRKTLNAMNEHEALHQVERECCAIMSAVLRINQLHALRGTLGIHDCDKIVEAANEVMEKVKTAHAQYETVVH